MIFCFVLSLALGFILWTEPIVFLSSDIDCESNSEFEDSDEMKKIKDKNKKAKLSELVDGVENDSESTTKKRCLFNSNSFVTGPLRYRSKTDT